MTAVQLIGIYKSLPASEKKAHRERFLGITEMCERDFYRMLNGQRVMRGSERQTLLNVLKQSYAFPKEP